MSKVMVNNASHFRSSAGPAEFNPLLRMNNSMGEMDFHPTRINECVKNIVATCSIVNCRKCKGARFASWISDNIVIADCHILHCAYLTGHNAEHSFFSSVLLLLPSTLSLVARFLLQACLEYFTCLLCRHVLNIGSCWNTDTYWLRPLTRRGFHYVGPVLT